MATRTILSHADVKTAGGTMFVASLALGAGLLAIDHYFAPSGSSLATRLFGRTSAVRVGADAASLPSTKLPPYAQQVLAQALTAETDSATLSSLADNLQAAGFTQAASQVRAKVHG